MIFILLIEDGKVGLLWQVFEQTEQGQTWYADALLEHVYTTLLVKGKLSVDGLQKGNHVPIIVPDEKVSQIRHAVVAPGLLTTGVILVGNTFVLQSTEEGLFRWKCGVVEPLKTVHVLVGEMTFRHLATVRLHILVVTEPGGYVIGHVKEFQLIRRKSHESVVAFDVEKRPDTLVIFFVVLFFLFVLFSCL